MAIVQAREVEMAGIGKEAMGHVRRLSVDIGPRPLGTPGNRAAADYVEGVLQDTGLQVERQWFPCTDWEEERVLLELGGHQLEGVANWFSPPCDVVGIPVLVGSLEELRHANLNGRIGILYGDLTKETLTPKRFRAYNPEHHQQIVRLLEHKRPAAFITVSLATQSLDRLVKDADLDIPSATVKPQAGLMLLRHVDEPLHLRIDSTRSPGRACNVVGVKPGVRSQRILVCAHYDTVLDTPGAVDNATGVGVVLSLAQVLSKWDLGAGLEFVAFNGEDCCGQGDEEYLRRYSLELGPVPWGSAPPRRRELDSILAVINADGAGQELGPNTIATMGGSQEFDGLVEGIRAEKYPRVLGVDPWPASDHAAYWAHGVPCVALTSGGVANIVHQPADTIEWVSPAKLAELVSLIADVVEALQDRTSDWCRPAKPGEDGAA
jgi:Iap family predicted aminopeptidase